MYYIIYETTNLINGKKYRGCHKTQNLEDGYLGSGKYLIRAIEKHGVENFKREILGQYETSEELFEAEKEFVNEEWVNRPDTYNLKIGGDGGWDHYSDFKNRNNRISKIRDYTSAEYKKKLSDTQKKYWSALTKEEKAKILAIKGFWCDWTGRHHSEETKRKIGKANSKNRLGNKNPSFGKCWVYNEQLKQSKSILKEDLQSWIDKGWIKGRKIRWQ